MSHLTVQRCRESKLIRWGLGGLIFGSGPLLLAIVIADLNGDLDPNPVGPGILCGLTFLPSLICLAFGFLKAALPK